VELRIGGMAGEFAKGADPFANCLAQPGGMPRRHLRHWALLPARGAVMDRGNWRFGSCASQLQMLRYFAPRIRIEKSFPGVFAFPGREA
jgi:hypothetical protein